MDHKAQLVINDLLENLRDKCFQVSAASDLIVTVAKTLGCSQAEQEVIRERAAEVIAHYLT